MDSTLQCSAGQTRNRGRRLTNACGVNWFLTFFQPNGVQTVGTVGSLSSRPHFAQKVTTIQQRPYSLNRSLVLSRFADAYVASFPFSAPGENLSGRSARLVTSLLILALALAAFALATPQGAMHRIMTLSFLSSAATLILIAGGIAGHGWLLQARSRRIGVADIPVVLDDIPYATVLTDHALTLIGANDLARRLFGVAENGAGLSHGDLPDGLVSALQRALPHLSPDDPGRVVAHVPQDTGSGWTIRCRSHSSSRLLWQIEVAGLEEATDVSAALPVVRLARDGTILFANDLAVALLGHLPDNSHEVFPNGVPASGHQSMLQSMNGPVPVLVADLPCPDTDRLLTLVPLTQGQTAVTAHSDWDRFDNLPVPLIWLSADGFVQRSNRSAQSYIGPECCPGVRLGDLTEGLGRPISDWLDETLSGHKADTPEFLRVTTGNTERFVQILLKPVSENGEASLLAVLSDATELKTLEAQFVQSQKMQAIGQLAGGVAHDFNNLLTAISGHCDLLMLRHDQGDPDYADLMQINQNANRAAALVNQLLAFSRKQTLRPVEIDLRETVSDLTHLLNRLVGEKITLSFSHDPVMHAIRADKRQLEQVLMNLVVNARDAIEDRGEIRIVTESVTYDTMINRDRAVIPPGDYVSVKVVDTGCGIPPERVSKVFEPFYTTKRIGEGTGLGLSTAYGIIKQTGGYIFVDSTLGQGTCFTLLFRAFKDSQKEMEETNAPITPTARHADGVVLLVEDEPPVRAFASRALQLRGYTVIEAESGEAALDLLADPQMRVDIFVSDVVMPGMDGPTWVRRALEDRPDVQVVFMSGYAEESFGEDQSGIPNSVFLPKPFSLSELTQTVQALPTG